MNLKNFSEILELSKGSSDKYIIVEDGKPAYVLMSIKEYKGLTSNFNSPTVADMSREELIEKINEDIAIWRSKQDGKEEEVDDHFLSGDQPNAKTEDEAEYLYEEIEKDF